MWIRCTYIYLGAYTVYTCCSFVILFPEIIITFSQIYSLQVNYCKDQVVCIFTSHYLVAVFDSATQDCGLVTVDSDLQVVTHDSWCWCTCPIVPCNKTSAQTAQKTLLPSISPLFSDEFGGLLPSDGRGIVDVGVCFGCRGNVFATHCLFWVCCSNFQPSYHNIKITLK
jgi:hypothetical protein